MKKAEVSLKVKKAASGLGLFANEPIAKGMRIIEYVGDIIDLDEANRRGGMYLFEVNPKKFIDGKDRKNIARYINHACGRAANCDVEIKAGRIWINAKKNIEEGQELSYDYGKEMFDAYIKPHGCRCAKCAEAKSTKAKAAKAKPAKAKPGKAKPAKAKSAKTKK